MILEKRDKRNFHFNMEDVKEILNGLLEIDSSEFNKEKLKTLRSNFDPQRYAYILNRLQEAGFLIFDSKRTPKGHQKIEYPIITWEGHQMLKNLNNEIIYKQLEEKVESSSGEVGFDVMKTVAKNYATKLMK